MNSSSLFVDLNALLMLVASVLAVVLLWAYLTAKKAKPRPPPYVV